MLSGDSAILPLQNGVEALRHVVLQPQQKSLRRRHQCRRFVPGDERLQQRPANVTDDVCNRPIDRDEVLRIVGRRNHMAMSAAHVAERLVVDPGIEFVHEERAEDGDVLLVRHLVEELLEPCRAARVPVDVENVDHLAPPANTRELAVAAGARDRAARDGFEDGAVRRVAAHEFRQRLVSVQQRELT